VFDARVVEGTPRPDREETIAVGWFSPSELTGVALTDFTIALLSDPDVHVMDGAAATAAARGS
jgi:hypothetical protein